MKKILLTSILLLGFAWSAMANLDQPKLIVKLQTENKVDVEVVCDFKTIDQLLEFNLESFLEGFVQNQSTNLSIEYIGPANSDVYFPDGKSVITSSVTIKFNCTYKQFLDTYKELIISSLKEIFK